MLVTLEGQELKTSSCLLQHTQTIQLQQSIMFQNLKVNCWAACGGYLLIHPQTKNYSQVY